MSCSDGLFASDFRATFAASTNADCSEADNVPHGSAAGPDEGGCGSLGGTSAGYYVGKKSIGSTCRNDPYWPPSWTSSLTSRQAAFAGNVCWIVGSVV
jgi:hypothetical protein